MLYEHPHKPAMDEIDRLNTLSGRDAERILDLEQKLDEAITRYEAAEEMAVVESEDADENALAVRDNLRKRITEQSGIMALLRKSVGQLEKKLEAGGHDNEVKYLLQQKELETLRIDYANRDDELRVSENEACELKQELEREKHASGQARVRYAHTNDEYLQERAVADYATRLIRRLMNDVRGCDCKED